MAEKDATARLRRAVQENNLFLVKRLIQRVDMRNPDPGPKRYTSLAWAAVLGKEETFEYLLNAGHDDQELSRDSDNNTILIILADLAPSPTSSYAKTDPDFMDATLRMARLYYDRYPFILDWSNSQGRTALHTAALKGNEELVRMLCDLGADVDLSDNQGNTPLHYASSWGHSLIVQLLIERGCQYAARNNEGCTPSDYAYSFYIRETLQETARAQYELNKKARRVFAQAAARGTEWSGFDTLPPAKAVDIRGGSVARMRSGSGGSRTTSTDDSGDLDSLPSGKSYNGQNSGSLQSQASQPLSSSSYLMPSSNQPSSSSAFSLVGLPSHSASSLGIPTSAASALSPIANRMREQDASAMEKYMRRNRSGSASTEVKSQGSGSGSADPSSAGPSANGDDISSLPLPGTVTPRRRLRPSMSASQLRSSPKPPFAVNGSQESRNRSGTNPPLRSKPSFSPPTERTPLPASPSRLTTQPRPSLSNSSRPQDFTGPPSAYAQFPFPEARPESDTASTPSTSSTTTTRRLPFNLLSSKQSSQQSSPSQGQSSSSGDLPSPGIHRRGGSLQSLR